MSSRRTIASRRVRSTSVVYRGSACAAAALAAAAPAFAGLTHRYSFNEVDGTAVNDSVGTAHGTVVDRSGNGAETPSWGDGALNLNNSGASADISLNNYIDLPNNIALTTNVTIEEWTTWGGGNNWQRLFDFGTTNAAALAGERLPDELAGGYGGKSYFFVSPQAGRNGNVLGSELRVDAAAVNVDHIGGGPLVAGEQSHFAMVIKGGAGGTVSLYRNGVQVAAAATTLDPALIPQLNMWIGRSNFSADPFYNGSLNEFRIYDTAQNAGQIAASFNAGPDALPAAVTTNKWNVTPGPADYNTAGNWQTGVLPVAGDTALFDNGGEATLAASNSTLVALVLQNGRVTVGAGVTYSPASIDFAPASTAGSAALNIAGTVITPVLSVDGGTTSSGTAAKSINFTNAAGVLEARGSIDAPNVTLGLGTTGGTLRFPAAGDTLTLRAAVTGSGTLTKAGPGRLNYIYPTGNTTDLTSGGKSLTISDGVVSIDTNGQNVAWAGNVGGTTGQLIKQGAGNLTLSGQMTRSNLWINGGGVIIEGAGSNVVSTAYLAIGQAANTTAVMTVRNGGTVTAQGTDFNVGDVVGTRGSLFVEGGTVTYNQLGVGKFGTAQGAVQQTGGVVQRGAGGGDSRIGGQGGTGDAAAIGVYDLRGGTLTNPANFQIGAWARGQINITGGAASHPGGYPVIGRFSTGIGFLNVTGGSFTQGAAGTRLIVAEEGAGTVNIGGTGIINVNTTQNEGLQIGALAAGIGRVNLFGSGQLNVPRVSRGAGQAHVSFNGGILRATADNATFLGDLSSAVVYSGGANIDTNGRNVTVAQNLAAPTGAGVAAIPLAGAGSGYVAAPIVQISGDGTGAAAIANVDAAGTITSITITSPGVGYATPPTVTLLGGNPATAATVGTVTTSVSTSGGLAKSGAGTLTLTGSNTYTGLTSVSAGTLLVNGSLASGASATGGTLGGSGTIAGNVTVNAATLAPGNSPGTLTVGGLSLIGGSSVLAVEVNGAVAGTGYDQVVVTAAGSGAVALGGAALNLALGYTPLATDTFTLINKQTPGAVTGTFAGLTEGSTLTAGGSTLRISYVGGDGNDVVLSVVPEPASAALLGLVAVGLLARRRGHNPCRRS